MRRAAPLLATLALAACVPLPEKPRPVVEGASLLGTPLVRPELSDEQRQHHDAALEEALARWRTERSEDAAIWVGRQLAYLGRLRAAVDWYGARLVDFPRSYRLRRHRGHRWITLRRCPDAVSDLTEAWELCRDLPDEVEPDGVPNAAGIPVSTDQTNVLYHLGLAHYLMGEFDAAADAWREGLARSGNDDMRVANANWLVLALRRAGREDEARAVLDGIDTDVELLENGDYLLLLRLEKGLAGAEEVAREGGAGGVGSATVGYGIGAWDWCAGRREDALARWRKVVAETPWNAFGHIAAEAELARAAKG